MLTAVEEYVNAVLKYTNGNTPSVKLANLVLQTFPVGQVELPADVTDAQIDACLNSLNIKQHGAAMLPLL